MTVTGIPIMGAIGRIAIHRWIRSTRTTSANWNWPGHFLQKLGTTVDYANPSTPLEINGVLYANIANTRNVVALDATSGQVLWLYRYDEGDRYDEAPRKGPGRGVAFYSKGDKQRVIDISPVTRWFH